MLLAEYMPGMGGGGGKFYRQASVRVGGQGAALSCSHAMYFGLLCSAAALLMSAIFVARMAIVAVTWTVLTACSCALAGIYHLVLLPFSNRRDALNNQAQACLSPDALIFPVVLYPFFCWISTDSSCLFPALAAAALGSILLI